MSAKPQPAPIPKTSWSFLRVLGRYSGSASNEVITDPPCLLRNLCGSAPGHPEVYRVNPDLPRPPKCWGPTTGSMRQDPFLDTLLKSTITGGKYGNGPSVCSAADCLPRTVHSTAVLQIVDRVLTVSLPPVRPSLSPSGLRTRASHCSKFMKKGGKRFLGDSKIGSIALK